MARDGNGQAREALLSLHFDKPQLRSPSATTYPADRIFRGKAAPPNAWSLLHAAGQPFGHLFGQRVPQRDDGHLTTLQERLVALTVKLALPIVTCR